MMTRSNLARHNQKKGYMIDDNFSRTASTLRKTIITDSGVTKSEDKFSLSDNFDEGVGDGDEEMGLGTLLSHEEDDDKKYRLFIAKNSKAISGRVILGTELKR